MNRLHVAVNFLLLSLLMSCCTITLNRFHLVPKFKGVDPKAEIYVNQWLDLAKFKGIKFKHKVTVGFDNIAIPGVVGMCDSSTYREITIDSKYWEYYTPIKRTIVLWHELGHCYCDKTHSFNGQDYGSDDSKNRNDPKQKEGFFADSCPVTLMYPYVIEDYCFTAHYAEYVEEIFKNCEPY